MYYNCYGYFEECPDWEIFLETLFMEGHNRVYMQQLKDSIQSKNQHKGYQIKGCVARNPANVKHELVKQLQKSGREHKKILQIYQESDKTW